MAVFIEEKNKSKCNGCGACMQICPRKCITMQEDSEGFLYPQIDEKECIHCKLCEKVCPELHPFEKQEPLVCFAAKNNDIITRLNSSSGGIFSALAEYVLSKNGIVFGARFDECWNVVMDYVDRRDDLWLFRGSKYLKCDVRQTYFQAKLFLEKGFWVLYTGSSCQIAGLKRFLKKDYANLIAVDYLCHGAPSPLLWKKYLHKITQGNLSKITEISFRNKKRGWRMFSLIISSEKRILVDDVFSENSYMKAFLSDLSLRPSCYSCSARNGHASSDITIGDHWAIHSVLPDYDDNQGTSLVLVNTIKGMEIIKQLDINTMETDFDSSKKWNGAFYPQTEEHLHRQRFFKQLLHSDDVETLIEKELRISFWDHFVKRIKHRKY